MSTKARRHGFADQHMVVVPDPVRRSALSHPLLRNLLVTDAGYFPRAQGHRVERPQGSATHLLIACVQGSGWMRAAGGTQTVSSGDVVWLAADRPHSYGASEETPWTIVWVHFTGEELPRWRAELGWAQKDPIGSTHVFPDRIPELGLDQIYNYLEHGYSDLHLLEASAALRSTFCALLRLGQSAGAARSTAERIHQVREQIVRTPARPHRLPELAASAGLSVPHFSLLFRRQTGYAPIDFLIRQRIRIACRLLDTTDETIAKVATDVGFSDPYYFSRIFHRIMGSSPKAYRIRIKA
jgi:AraC-like DNA-binding protein